MLPILIFVTYQSLFKYMPHDGSQKFPIRWLARISASLAGFKSDTWPLCSRSQDGSTNSVLSDWGLQNTRAFSEMNLK